jgi:light-regulated signal transduction histidine kinase (bacteriophytochrome)
VVGAIQDITDQKMYESSLKSLNEMLEARARELANSNAELEQFAYVASHDLQEPLRMITSFLTQLELKYGEQLDERARKYIHFAVDGARRMRQIILDLLEFSRVGRIEEEPEIIDLNQLVAEVCTLQSKRLREKNAEVNFSDLPEIQGYRTPLIQVFQNLISNAVKYSKESIAPVVNITSRESAAYWEFSVQDNGIGMEADHFDKIFVIFQRLHTKDKFSGSGIGLAIVKKIIENLGGKIWVESELGNGTTFFFTLKKSSES